jgi:uncharacterized paraquat-inducible protein A
MYFLGAQEYPANRPQLRGTLWHCTQCDSFVTIHCANRVETALCPICVDSELEQCGTPGTIRTPDFADA